LLHIFRPQYSFVNIRQRFCRLLNHSIIMINRPYWPKVTTEPKRSIS
jgi:hypothetical protein